MSNEYIDLAYKIGLGHGNNLTSELKLSDIVQSDLSEIHHKYHEIFQFKNNDNINTEINLNIEQELILAEKFGFVVMKNDTCISDCLRNGKLFEKFLLAVLSEIIPKDKNMFDIVQI